MVSRQNPSTSKARQSIIELVLRKCMQVDVRTVKRLLFRVSIVKWKENYQNCIECEKTRKAMQSYGRNGHRFDSIMSDCMQ